MILLCSNSQNRIKGGESLIGDFISPRQYQLYGKTNIWAADNDAFSGFNPDRYRRMLDAFANATTQPKFVTVPDVVCDHRATVEKWLEWSKELTARKLPRAFVLQNGVDQVHPQFALPWPNLDAIFIGGDTDFKFTPWVRACVHWAKRLGKWVHMGRVNSVKRMMYAKNIGCDSCDGSGMARFPDSVLLPMVEALKREMSIESKQLTLL